MGARRPHWCRSPNSFDSRAREADRIIGEGTSIVLGTAIALFVTGSISVRKTSGDTSGQAASISVAASDQCLILLAVVCSRDVVAGSGSMFLCCSSPRRCCRRELFVLPIGGVTCRS